MAWYNTGNIALTNGSATVTGSGTNFLVGAQIGEALYAPDGKLYEIQTINSATVITLASTYLGSTASGQNYQIIPTQSLVADLASDVTDLISDFADVRDYAGNGKFNDGAVGTPGITFTQDQDNGLYRIGSNNWALAAGGQKIVDISTSGIDVTGSVTTTGNVGIGVTPVTTLDVKGASDLVASFRSSTNNGNTSEAKIRAVDSDSSHVATFLFQGYEHRFQNASGVERMRIDSSGNVGIGTSTFTSASTGRTVLEVNGASASALINLSVNGTRQGYIFADTTDMNIYNVDNGSLNFGTNNALAATIDSNGSVGIGVVPSAWHASWKALQIGPIGFVGSYQAGTTDITALGSNVYSDGAYKYIETDEAVIYKQQNGSHIFDVAPSGTADAAISWTTAAIIDNSGNLLVGKTASGTANTGAELRNGSSNHAVVATSTSETPLVVNRKTNDGSLVNLLKDGTVVGSIGANGGNIYIGQGDTTIMFSASSDAILPKGTDGASRDNAIDLGQASVNRFNDAFITNGVTTGSDGNDKQDIETLSDAEQRVAVACKGLLRKWRWKDAVEAKGDDARIHFGIIAQDLQAAFEAEGLDAGRYAMFMSNTWTDEETGEERTRLGVRYHELLAFIIAAI